MEQIHDRLLEKSTLYGAWHRIPHVSLVHVTVLVAVFFYATHAVQAASATSIPRVTFSEGGQGAAQAQAALAELNAQFLRATKPGSLGKEISAEVSTLAHTRKAALVAEAKNNPRNFLLHALSDDVRKQLPSQLQALIEEDVDVQGTALVMHVDGFDEGPTYTRHELEVETSQGRKLYHVHFVGDAPASFITGRTVKVHGKRIDNELVPIEFLDGTGGTQVVSAATTAVPAAHKTLVILVNFTNSVTQPWTPAQVAQTWFTYSSSTSTFYKETSFGAVSIEGDVAGWYTLPYTNAGCWPNSYDLWGPAADQMAIAAGIDVSSYAHKFYIANSRPADCTDVAWSLLGDGTSVTIGWSFSYMNASMFSHEMGHALSSMHARWLKCGGSAVHVYTNCTIDEYGDPSSVMGDSWKHYNHFNGPEKIGVGWLSPTSQMQTVTTNGAYTITHGETNEAGIKILKIRKADTNEWYYVSYRKAIGFDTNLPSAFLNGASIHIWNSDPISPIYPVFPQTQLIDTTPGDNNALNAPLSDGTSFIDPTNGITVTQMSHTADSVTLNVQFGAPQCVPSAPGLSVSPLSQSGAPGVMKNYTLTLSNADNVLCGKSTFSLSSALPTGWIGTLSTSTVTLLPGKSATSTLTVTPHANALTGTYVITTSAADPLIPAHQKSVSASYTSIAPVPPDNIVPTTAITAPLNGATISATSTITATASDNKAVTKVELWKDGALFLTDALAPYSFVWFTGTSTTMGTHTLQSKAYDAAGNVGVSSVISVKVIDKTPPIVTVLTPKYGEKVFSGVDIAVHAIDNVGVTSIVIRRTNSSGALIASCAATTTCKGIWSYAGMSAGTRTPWIRARDVAGNLKTITSTFVK